MNYRFLTIAFFLFLIGCSGGISGTGDGGPIVPVEGDVANTGDSPVGADSLATRFEAFPAQLLLNLPDTLRRASEPTVNSNTITSPGIKLRQRITASELDAIAIQIDLTLLQSHLETIASDSTDGNNNTVSDANCLTDSGLNCELSDVQISVLADTAAQMLATELLAPYQSTLQLSNSITTRSTLRAGDTIRYINVSLQSGLDGFFDNRLQYSRDDGSRITLQWSSDQLLVSVLAQNTDATLHTLLQADSSEMTLRRTDHLRGDASIQLLAIQNAAGLEAGATYLEADLNDDEPFFVRATGNAEISAIFSESLLTDNILYRETTDATGQLTNLETCIKPCDQWQSLLSTQTLPDNFFENESTTADNLSRSVSNPIDTSILQAQVSEFVVTTGDNAESFASNPMSLADSLVCGGQRLRTGVRAFCWQPTPLGTRAYLFEESRAIGVTTYKLVGQSDSL